MKLRRKKDAELTAQGGQPETDDTAEDGTRTTSDDASSPKDSDGLTLDLPDEVDALIEESKQTLVLMFLSRGTRGWLGRVTIGGNW